MGIARMDAVHQIVKVVFNLLGGLDDDPAARDHKIHLLFEWTPRLFHGCSGQAQGWVVAPFSRDGFHGFSPLNSGYIADIKAGARKRWRPVIRVDDLRLKVF